MVFKQQQMESYLKYERIMKKTITSTMTTMTTMIITITIIMMIIKIMTIRTIIIMTMIRVT
jgi:hypothetical protein